MKRWPAKSPTIYRTSIVYLLWTTSLSVQFRQVQFQVSCYPTRRAESAYSTVQLVYYVRGARNGCTGFCTSVRRIQDTAVSFCLNQHPEHDTAGGSNTIGVESCLCINRCYGHDKRPGTVTVATSCPPWRSRIESNRCWSALLIKADVSFFVCFIIGTGFRSFILKVLFFYKYYKRGPVS